MTASTSGAYASCLDLRCTACGFLGREHANHDESGDIWDDEAPSQNCTGWFVVHSQDGERPADEASRAALRAEVASLRGYTPCRCGKHGRWAHPPADDCLPATTTNSNQGAPPA